MRRGRQIALPLFGLGIALFLVAVVTGSNVVYGVADILIGSSIGLYAAQGAPPPARNPQLYLLGLVIAAAGAILDGVLTLLDQTAVAGGLTFVVVAGALIALLGYGTARR